MPHPVNTAIPRVLVSPPLPPPVGAVHPSRCFQTAVLTLHYTERVGKKETGREIESAAAG